MFNNIYKNKKVLITGHTGFKGSWLSLWLNKLGAKVYGISLDPHTNPNHYELLNLDIDSRIGDVRDYDFVERNILEIKPDIIFHMAAQAIVGDSYKYPKQTFETNVIGTLNIFETCRTHNLETVIVNITSDKCYSNKEQIWGYKETDPMGGYDVYSCSKGCSELLTDSYRNSFFHPDSYEVQHNILLASVRAGNVIGGGDWAHNRLIPDIMKAIDRNESVEIRSPYSTRPWQHVLEPLGGYLLLGKQLLEGRKECADCWNFGPGEESSITVEEVIGKLKKYWSKLEYKIVSSNDFHEAGLLKLDCSKANYYLKWHPVWDCEDTLKKTTLWYKEFYENQNVLSEKDLCDYIDSAQKQNMSWIL